MQTLIQILIAVIAVSLVSILGLFIFYKQKSFNKMLFLLVSFAAGTMIGVAFLDLLPEVIEEGFSESIPLLIIGGILSFFVLEKFLHWHHHHAHEEHDEVHTFTYLNLVGDAIHNFLDGAVIAISFMAGTSLGIATTIAILAHEIPQEIADFSVLIYGGFSKMKALVYNFLTALTAVLGAMLTYFFSSLVESSHIYIASLAIGGFIYIAGTDLIPEIHKEKDVKKSSLQLLMMVLGIALIWFVGKVFEGH
ncbi:MAG TPA: ZIP family metal transporter [Candidatus Nanoarchaeia archaeon]|nr:ZIP family metal transporter [Candidatus Nanoarchaeia archaeon]